MNFLVTFNMADIISYDPFMCLFTDYEGYSVTVTFKCPFCGSVSCRRSLYNFSNNFFVGHFRCSVCSAGSFNGEPFNYYSPVFICHRVKFEQLFLF